MDTQDSKIPDHLRALKQAAIEAKLTYYAHEYTGSDDIAAQIAFDLEERRLQMAFRQAEGAYERALSEYLKAEAA